MKLPRLRYLMPFILTVIMLSSLVGWGVSGQSIQAVDDEDFRTKLTELNNDLIKLYPYIESPSNLLELINQNQRNISELTTEELAQIEEIFSLYPELFDAPKVLLSIFERIEIERALMSSSMASCPYGPSIEEVYIAKGLELVANLVCLPLQYLEPVSLTVYAIATATALTMEGLYEVREACLQANHYTLLEEHDALLEEHDALLKEHDETMQQLVNDVQFTLDNKTELRRVHLQVIELKEKQVFLVYATEAGIPIADVDLISVRASERNPVLFMDVEGAKWEMLGDDIGTYILEINLPKELKNANLFKFEVQHAPDPEVAHFGSVIFDRSTQNTITTGQ